MSAFVCFFLPSSRLPIKMWFACEKTSSSIRKTHIHQVVIKHPMNKGRKKYPRILQLQFMSSVTRRIHSIRESKAILVCHRQFTSFVSSHNFIYLFIFPYFHIYCLRIFQQQFTIYYIIEMFDLHITTIETIE